MISEMDKFRDARCVMKKNFDEDGGLRIAYLSNIAMLLCDKYNLKDFEDFDIRNQAAEDILELIFGDYYSMDKNK